jgi:hypothetical protein
MKTHAEFLEELKEYVNEALFEAFHMNTSAYYELNKVAEKIEQFEAQLKED